MSNIVLANPNANGTNGGTTGANDTTGATLIVIAAAYFTGPVTISDSKGNTWSPLTAKADTGAGTLFSQLFYCLAPTVGTGHTFTVAGASTFSAISVEAHSGGPYTFVSENGAGYVSAGTSVQPGAPSGSCTLLVTGLLLSGGSSPDPAIDSGFTVATYQALVGGVSEGVSQAYLYQSLGAGVNPTWTFTSNAGGAATMAAFTTGGGGGSNWGPLVGQSLNRIIQPG